jgi:hypothetical protein
MKKKIDKVGMGAARRLHFEAGKTPKMWVGNPITVKDRKKEAARKACRNRVTTD